MDRISKLFDLTTPVALLATGAGIVLCLFFLFASTTFGKNLQETVVNGSVDIQVSLRWIQPILGQAIVEDTLLKQQYGNHIDGPVTTMKPTTLEGRATHQKVLETAIASHIENLEADHSTRVQWILGRLIVTFTSQGIRTGMVTADKSADKPNRRIIALAQETGTKLDDAFKAERQARIGTTIVSETLPRARRTDNSLERVGLIF